MPNCFQLFRKGQSTPEVLQEVDAALCAHLGLPVDPVNWCRNWYHVIGFLIACKGTPLGSDALRDEIRRWHSAPGYKPERCSEMLNIHEWMAEHYTSDAFVIIGKR